MSASADWSARIEQVLEAVPEMQRPAARLLLVEYGPRLLDVTIEEAWAWLRRLMAGDLEAVMELDSKLSNDEFLARVKANTARWENVAAYNKVRDDLRREILLKMAPVIVSILLALVGL